MKWLNITEKRHFADPSIACALLNLTIDKLINDLNTFGFLFEALVERDLKIYANSFDAKCFCGLSNAAYKREDGVYVVPIIALKP